MFWFDFVNDHQMTSSRALLHVPNRNLFASTASVIFHLILGSISPVSWEVFHLVLGSISQDNGKYFTSIFSTVDLRVMMMTRKMMTMKMKNMTMMMTKNMTIKMMAKLTPCRASLKHLPSSSPPRHPAGLWEPTFSFWSRLCRELSWKKFEWISVFVWLIYLDKKRAA